MSLPCINIRMCVVYWLWTLRWSREQTKWGTEGERAPLSVCDETQFIIILVRIISGELECRSQPHKQWRKKPVNQELPTISLFVLVVVPSFLCVRCMPALLSHSRQPIYLACIVGPSDGSLGPDTASHAFISGSESQFSIRSSRQLESNIDWLCVRYRYNLYCTTQYGVNWIIIK